MFRCWCCSKDYEERNQEVGVGRLGGYAIGGGIISTFDVFNAQLFTFNSIMMTLVSVKENEEVLGTSPKLPDEASCKLFSLSSSRILSYHDLEWLKSLDGEWSPSGLIKAQKAGSWSNSQLRVAFFPMLQKQSSSSWLWWWFDIDDDDDENLNMQEANTLQTRRGWRQWWLPSNSVQELNCLYELICTGCFFLTGTPLKS